MNAHTVSSTGFTRSAIKSFCQQVVKSQTWTQVIANTQVVDAYVASLAVDSPHRRPYCLSRAYYTHLCSITAAILSALALLLMILRSPSQFACTVQWTTQVITPPLRFTSGNVFFVLFSFLFHFSWLHFELWCCSAWACLCLTLPLLLPYCLLWEVFFSHRQCCFHQDRCFLPL